MTIYVMIFGVGFAWQVKDFDVVRSVNVLFSLRLFWKKGVSHPVWEKTVVFSGWETGGISYTTIEKAERVEYRTNSPWIRRIV